jgi:cysteine-rich repeat protein
MNTKYLLAAVAAFALLIAIPSQSHACGCECGNGILDPGEQCDDGNRINGDGCSADCMIECGGEGCTPGYWKQPHHLDSWSGAGPDDLFNAVFGTNVAFNAEQCGDIDPTLLQALKCKGGGLSALARHAVAALLNSYNGGVSYDYTAAQVKEMVKNAIDSERYGPTKNKLAESNELGCPLN